MFREILDIIITSAEGAFLQVGVFVGIVLLIFGYINYKKDGGLIREIERRKKWQPIIGAVLGLTPGCGGAILVMPLFIKGTVTFGTIVATLIATMGDSAFVLITSRPKEYIMVSIFSLIIGIVTGYVVDYLGIGKGLIKRKNDINKEHEEKYKEVKTEFERGIKGNDIKIAGLHIGHEEGDRIDMALHHRGNNGMKEWVYSFTHGVGYKIFWGILCVGLILGVLLLAQVDVNADLGIDNFGKFIGVFGTVFSFGYMILSKKFIKDDSHEEVESKLLSLKEMFVHNAMETAFVNTWVFVAYLAYEIGVYFAGGAGVVEGWLTATGFAAVIIGALLGLIPGCGPQIVFVALFSKGVIPFAALLSNAISQDGDALFPLIVMNKKSSLVATVVTTIPAILFGIIVYFMGI